MDTQEPKITQDKILKLTDPAFSNAHVCIVTGCGTGIGRATAVAAAANQLTTVGLDIDSEQGHRTQAMAREMGGQMHFIKADLARDADIEQAVAEAARLGSIRYLANIAGIQHIDSIENFPMEKYDQMQRIMLRAPFLLSKRVFPHFRKNSDGVGIVGNMASVHGHICTLNKPVYNITKFGLRALSQSISAEGGGKIRSFTVSTGYVKTPLALNQIPAQAEQRGISQEAVVRDIMMGRSQIKEMMAPIDVANLFMFGFSDFSRHLIGGDMLYDGGMVLTY